MTISYDTTLTSAANATSYEFVDGVIVPSNCLVVVVAQAGAASGIELTSATLGGDAMDIRATIAAARSQAIVGQVRGAGTYTLVLNFTGSPLRCAAHVFFVTDYTSEVPADVDSSAAGSGVSSLSTLNFSTDGFAVYGAMIGNTEEISWSAANEANDQAIEAQRFASATKTASGDANTETASWTTSTGRSIIGAVWAPAAGGGGSNIAAISHHARRRATT